MKILITNGINKLSQNIGKYLSKEHEIQYIENPSKKESLNKLNEINFTLLDSSKKTNKIINNSDIIIYQGLLEDNKTPNDLNNHVQKSYNLLSAAIETGISNFILISSLELIKSYDDSNTVTETWKSTPSTEIPFLSGHLTEIIFKEFARTFPINISVLRLGYPINYIDSDNDRKIKSSVKLKEILISIERIISLKNPKKWEIFHLQSDVKLKKFLTKKTNEILGVPIDNRKLTNESFYNPKFGVSER